MSSESPTPTVSTLGRGMVHRGRRQTVLARRWSSAGLIGAVGRASVGFGLAVGRSRAIRPVVQVGDVNSAALRPPVDFWRPGADEPDETAMASFPGAGSAADAGRVAGAPVAAPPAPASVAASPRRESARRPAVPTARRVDASSRPTWTEQVIQRSSIGYTAPAPGSPVPALEVPDDFVSSGDAKLDQLRLLVRGRQQNAQRPPAGRKRERSAERPHAAPATTPPSTTQPATTRGDTSAGRSTGPGLFGRTIRPQPIEPSATGEVRRSPAVDAQLPTASARPSARRQPTVPGAARRPAAPAAAPTKVDRLRALLVEQGILSSDTAGDPDGGDAEPTTGSGTSTGPRRVPPAGNAPARPAGQGRSDTVRRSTSRDGAGMRPDPARPVGAPTGTEDGPSASSPSGNPRPADTPPAQSGAPTAGAASMAVPDRSDTAPPPAVGRRAAPSLATTGDLRVRRMMSFGGADQERETPAEFAPVPDQDRDGFIERAPFGERSPFDPSLPVAAVDTVRGPSGVPLLRRRHRHSWADQRPELPSAIALLRRPTEPVASAPDTPAQVRADLELDGGPPAVLRRVTLPRALSVQHRPEPVLRRHRIEATPPLRPAVAAAPSDGVPNTSGVAGGAASAPVARSVGASVAPAHDTASAVDTIRTGATATAPGDTARTGATATAPGDTARTGDRAPGRATAEDVEVPGAVAADVMAAAVRPHAIVRRVAADDPAEAAAPTSLSGSTSTTSIRDDAGELTADPAGRSATVRPPGVDRAVSPVRRRAARRRHSSVADGPGALLDVVRRTRQRSAVSHDAVVRDVVGTQEGRDESRPGSGVAASVAPPAARTASTSRTASSASLPDGGTRGHRDPIGGVDAVVGDRSADRSAGDRGDVAARRIVEVNPPRRVPTAAAELADRFMTELSQTIQRQPAPLPMPYRPMADVITPGRRVMFSTDEASRRALRSVGKVAATTDHVIHLDPEPVARHRLDEVIAHELTHVAHPSPTPRFFDDVDDSPEERRAEEVAKIMTSSPIAPGNSRPQPAVQRRPAGSASQPDVIRRSPATTSPAPSGTTSSGTSPGSSISADALAARITGRSSPDTVRRWAEGGATPSGPRPSTAPTTGASTERATGAGARDDLTRYLDSDAGKAWFEKMLRSNTSLLMSLLEDRIIVEAERRGGRTWRGA